MDTGTPYAPPPPGQVTQSEPGWSRRGKQWFGMVLAVVVTLAGLAAFGGYRLFRDTGCPSLDWQAAAVAAAGGLAPSGAQDANTQRADCDDQRAVTTTWSLAHSAQALDAVSQQATASGWTRAGHNDACYERDILGVPSSLTPSTHGGSVSVVIAPNSC